MAKQVVMPFESRARAPAIYEEGGLAAFNGERVQNRTTPQWLVDDCELRFAGRDGFLLDVAADALNAKAPFYLDETDDALSLDWLITKDTKICEPWFDRRGINISIGEEMRERLIGRRDIACFCNPPFDRCEAFVLHGHREVGRGSNRLSCFVVPARVEQAWWQDVVKPFAWHTEFPDGRVNYDAPEGVEKSSAYFPSAVVVFQHRIVARSRT